MKITLQKTFIFGHFCLMMVFLGGVVFETFINYPNWFHDIPSSLNNAKNFLQVRNPGHFFQTIFPLTILMGLGFVIVAWKVKPARTFILISLLILIGIEALTIGYVYPRIGIMLREGAAVHSVGVLKQTATEFQIANQIRVAFILLAEALSFLGLWKYVYRKDEMPA